MRVEQVNPGEEGFGIVVLEPGQGFVDHLAGAAAGWRRAGAPRRFAGAVQIEPLVEASARSQH